MPQTERRTVSFYYSYIAEGKENSGEIISAALTCATGRYLHSFWKKRKISITALICNTGGLPEGMIKKEDPKRMLKKAIAWLNGVDISLEEVPDIFTQHNSLSREKLERLLC